MKPTFYRLIRELHLYLGLFVSPFVLVYAISAVFVAHTWLPRLGAETSTRRHLSSVSLPDNLPTLSGRPLIESLRSTLEGAGVYGEVGFVRHLVQEGRLIVPVTIPGRETTVSINLVTREADIVTRERGLADALVTLHKSPGQHGPDIRMNWFQMRAWRWMADATVYLFLFITVSGIYLWYMLRSERSVGLLLLFVGAFSFFGMAYALSH